jgi:hypothetical protein
MTCAEFQQELPDVLEGASRAELEAHLSSCPRCSDLVSDLKAISEQAYELRESEEPSPRVWQSIETALRHEGLIRDASAEPRFLAPASRRRWGPTAWLVPIAAVLMVGMVLFINRPFSSPTAQRSTQPTQQVVSPSTATSDAANDDDRQVLSEVEKNQPLLKSAYEDNLKHVNAYIRDAQSSVDQNPDDGDAQQYLMQAYEQKAMLYEMALDRSLP